MGIFHVEKGKAAFQAEGSIFAKSLFMARDESGKLDWAKLGRMPEEAKDIGLSVFNPGKPLNVLKGKVKY